MAEEQSDFSSLFGGGEEYQYYQYPMVSVVLPTYSCAQKISLTLESILEQRYPSYELIIIDAKSKDHTLEVIKSFQDEKVTLLTCSDFKRYEMLNKGIDQAKGEYICFLFPGDYFITQDALKLVMQKAMDHEMPDMVYCGTILRDGRSEAKALFRPFTMDLIRKGHQPTSLQACWFKKELFQKIGCFDGNYELRGGFDLMCRLILEQKIRCVALHRVLTDFDMRFITRKMIWCHFRETAATIYRHFGLRALLAWLTRQKDLRRIYDSWAKSIKIAFSGR